jgi:hypothetical protein
MEMVTVMVVSCLVCFCAVSAPCTTCIFTSKAISVRQRPRARPNCSIGHGHGSLSSVTACAAHGDGDCDDGELPRLLLGRQCTLHHVHLHKQRNFQRNFRAPQTARVYRGGAAHAGGLLHCGMTLIDSAKTDCTMQFLVENYT